MLDEPAVAYVAGLLDALARFTTFTTGGTRLPLVAVSTSNFAMLDHLGEVTAVKAFKTHRSYDRHRCADHCDSAHDHVTSTSGRWSVSGAKATIVLGATLPYLRVQREDAEAAFEVGLQAPYKSATPAKMAALGWPLPEGWN